MNQGTPIKGRPWLQTQRGLAWCADEPEAFPYCIREIVHALGQLNRFAGHATFPYSVLHHSLLVAGVVERALAETRTYDAESCKAMCRMALLHDGAEAFCVDMPAPIKRMPEMAGYRTLIKRTEVAIANHFGLFAWLGHPAIRHADMVLLATEKRDVLGPSPHDDDWGVDLPPPSVHRISFMTEGCARKLFLDAWETFGGEL